MIVSCGSCQSRFKIDPAKVPAGGTRIRCPKCKGVITVGAVPPSRPAPTPEAPAEPRRASPPPPADAAAAPLVVVAHGNAAFSETLAGFLKRNRFACETAHDGESALALVADRRPAAVLIDVALPGIVGYKLCEEIKGDRRFAGVPVVLIGAIYDRTRYRRPPASLYGSDGYIEKHEIPEKLVPMLRALLRGEAPPAGLGEQEPEAEGDEGTPSVQPGAAPAPPAGEPTGGAPGSEQARRLARIIVSDIVLYNPDVVKKGMAEGNLADLLEDELREGRDLLKARVGSEAAGADYVLEALQDYVRRMSARGPAAAQR